METPPVKKVVVKKVMVKKVLCDVAPTLSSKTQKNKVPIEKKKETKKKVVKPKIKSEFPKQGQLKPTPPENDALRKFYTSLLAQNPKSEMAKKWCTDHGLFPNQPENLFVSLAKLSIK